MQQKNASSSSTSSCDSYMLQGSNAFKWLSISSKCGLEDYTPACINLIVSNQLPVPAEGITCLVQPHHADALILGLQKGQLEAMQLFKAKQQECLAALSEVVRYRERADCVYGLEHSVDIKRKEIQSLKEAQEELATQVEEANARIAKAAEPYTARVCVVCRNAAYLMPGGKNLVPCCIFCGNPASSPHWQISQ